MKDGEFQAFSERVEGAVNKALAPLSPEAGDAHIDEKLQAIIGVLVCSALYRIALLKWPSADLRDVTMQIVDAAIETNAETLKKAANDAWPVGDIQ